MATFTVERTYLVPVFQHVVVEATSAEEAMRVALDDDNWDSSKLDYNACRAEFVSGAWEGGVAYGGRALPVPTEFQEASRSGDADGL
ncbi:hypothetical protein [Labrys sp. 22185]|uniref:hypothetical protein n=1 Tax=Labrys sp. 22185 TaxID=3453888 RepID=UPI003F8485A3